MAYLAHQGTHPSHRDFVPIINLNRRQSSSMWRRWRISPPWTDAGIPRIVDGMAGEGGGSSRRRRVRGGGGGVSIWNDDDVIEMDRVPPSHHDRVTKYCRGGGGGGSAVGSSPVMEMMGAFDGDSNVDDESYIPDKPISAARGIDAHPRGKESMVSPSVAVMNNAGGTTNNSYNERRMEEGAAPEIDDDTRHTSPYRQVRYGSTIRPRLVIEFDTKAGGGGDANGGGCRGGIQDKIRRRIGTDHDERGGKGSNRGPALAISLDLSPPQSSSMRSSCDGYRNSVIAQNEPGRASSDGGTLLESLRLPFETSFILLTQTAALLPHLILSRRALNYTWIAIVDYFRGRTFRTTYTRLERAYLRYYEFPAVTRAIARLVSQMGILLGLSWAVRLWMFWVFSSDVAPFVFGTTGIDIALVGARAGREIAIGPGWKVGLPCHRRGKGMAWLCGFFWIGTVVGIGHVLGVALSVWGGPLRLQATAQHPESPKLSLRRIIHHPIQWIQEMEEWKHFSLRAFRHSNRNMRGRVSGENSFNPDPLLFPVTWLPLRWLQIFALAKAFSTDPQRYRWCPPDNDKAVIPRLMKQYLVQLALCDEWRRVCLGEMRVGLGIVVMLSHFVALVWMVCTTFTLDGGAAAMLVPSVFAAVMSGAMNFIIYWNRLGLREQRKALNAIGFA